MLKFQDALSAILITCCFALIACDEMDATLDPVTDDMIFGDAMTSKNVISLVPAPDITAAAVGDQVEIDIKIMGGKGVAGYSPLIVFDSTALKFVDATNGGYLPTGGLWMTPQLKDDGSYEIRLTIADTTTSGTSVDFPPLPDVPGVTIEQIMVDTLLFEVPGVPPEFAAPGAQYWAFSFLASSPFGVDTKLIPVDGDGTLVTLTFEVLTAKPGVVRLLEANLSDTNDETLAVTVQNDVVTVNASAVP